MIDYFVIIFIVLMILFFTILKIFMSKFEKKESFLMNGYLLLTSCSLSALIICILKFPEETLISILILILSIIIVLLLLKLKN